MFMYIHFLSNFKNYLIYNSNMCLINMTLRSLIPIVEYDIQVTPPG